MKKLILLVVGLLAFAGAAKADCGAGFVQVVHVQPFVSQSVLSFSSPFVQPVVVQRQFVRQRFVQPVVVRQRFVGNRVIVSPFRSRVLLVR